MNRFSIASAASCRRRPVSLPLGAAQARIECDGNFQVVQGQAFATPYCQEQNLARVAQGYGMRISFDIDPRQRQRQGATSAAPSGTTTACAKPACRSATTAVRLGSQMIGSEAHASAPARSSL